MYDTIQHFGVKGMRWGVRKDRGGSSDPRRPISSEQAERRRKLKKALVVGGVIALTVGAAVVGAQLHKNGKLPYSKIPERSKKLDEAVKKVVEVPTDLIYTSKPYAGSKNRLGQDINTDYSIIIRGGVKDPGVQATQLHLNRQKYSGYNSSENYFRKLTNGDIESSFKDSLGRMDAAGRIIIHDLFIPASMAAGVESIEDIQAKFGPRLEAALTEEILNRKGF